MTNQIRAPWTPEQVAALNRFQAEGGMHPFTCGNDHATDALHLVAHEDGWHCWLPDCDYRQDWAHAFMADPGAWSKFPFGERHGPTPEELAALRAPTPPQDGPHAPQEGPHHPDAGAETPDGAGGRQTGGDGRETLREQYAAAVRGCVEEGNIRYGYVADAVIAVRDAESERLRQQLDFASEAAKEGRSALTAAEQQRDQLAAALRQALDAFEAYWARASYCGPGETAIQPEHLQAWRAVLNGKEQP